MQQLKMRPSTARGWPCGATHHRVRHSDAIVAEAKALRQAGWTHAAIGARLNAPRSTVEAWTSNRRRNRTPVRIVVTRAPTPPPGGPSLRQPHEVVNTDIAIQPTTQPTKSAT